MSNIGLSHDEIRQIAMLGRCGIRHLSGVPQSDEIDVIDLRDQLIAKTFTSLAERDVFVHEIRKEIVRVETSRMFMNLDGLTRARVAEPISLSIPHFKKTESHGVYDQLLDSTQLTMNDFQTVQNIIVAALAPNTTVEKPKEEAKIFHAPPKTLEEFSCLTLAAQKAVFNAMRIPICVNMTHALKRYGFLEEELEKLDSLIEEHQLRCNVDFIWSRKTAEQKAALLKKMESIEPSSFKRMDFWNSPSLTTEHLCLILAILEEEPEAPIAPPTPTMAQRIVKVTNYIFSSRRGTFLRGLLTSETTDVEAAWRLNNLTEAELTRMETFIHEQGMDFALVKELETRDVKDFRHRIRGLFGGELELIDYYGLVMLQNVGVAWINLNVLQQQVIIEFLRSLPHVKE